MYPFRPGSRSFGWILPLLLALGLLAPGRTLAATARPINTTTAATTTSAGTAPTSTAATRAATSTATSRAASTTAARPGPSGPRSGAGGAQPAASPSTAVAGLGVLGSYPLQTFPLTDRMALLVNLASGDLMVRATDLAVAGTGLDLVVDRWYNSLAAAPAQGNAGNWTTGTAADVYLAFPGNGSSSSFTLHGPSGCQFAFTQNPDGSFTSPPGLDATLVQVQGNPNYNYVLTDHATGERLYFAGTGGNLFPDYSRLVQTVDANGNTLAFSYFYDGGQFGPPMIDSITDTQGRQVTFGYGLGTI